MSWGLPPGTAIPWWWWLCPGQGWKGRWRTGLLSLLCWLSYTSALRDSQCAIPTQVLGSYLRQGAAVTHLLPLYVTSSPGESSDTESAEDDEPEDSQLPLGPRARCVVCQLERVTRAALPCRHAITCATCFERLKSQCPMCRAFINSYFLLGPETSPRVETPPASVHTLSLWQRSQQTWRRINEWFNRGLEEN